MSKSIPELDKVLEGYCAREIGGLNCVGFAAVNDKGETIYSKVFGYQKVERPSPPLTQDTVFWLGSVSKLVTSLACMIAVERGLISLDTDLKTIIPWLKEAQILKSTEGESGEMEAYDGPITLWNCLTQTSGFAYSVMSKDLQDWAAKTGKKETFASGNIKGFEYPMIYKPGNGWFYGPSLDWAGFALQSIVKQPMEEFMGENIFSKLGMTSTTFRPASHENVNNNLAQTAFRLIPPKALESGLKPGALAFPLVCEDDCAGSGIYSTLSDMTKFMTCVLQGGAPIVSKPSIEAMMTPQLKENQLGAFMKMVGDFAWPTLGQQWPKGTKGQYGFGLSILQEDIPGRRKAGTASAQGMAGNFLWFDRTTGIAGLMMTQVFPPGDAVVNQCLPEAETALYSAL